MTYPDPNTAQYAWTRGEQGALSSHFTKQEFQCHCNRCVIQQISMDLMRKLEAMRMEIGRPINILSGFRCKERQDALRKSGFMTAEGISQHELGTAADISVPGMTGEALLELAEKAGFKAIGLAETWIHVDLRNDKVRRWKY